MLSEDEAHVAYTELFQKLREIGAHVLVGEIERAVGLGRVQDHARLFLQESLPATAALEIALRMLVAWLEPVFLISEAEVLFREASNGRFDAVRWMHDRLDMVEPESGFDPLPVSDQPVMDVRSLDISSVEQLREDLERLHTLIVELAATEGG